MKRKACTWIVWRRNKCWISWVLWPYLIYWDSQKAITGEQVLHLCILNSHHTLFLTKFLPSDSKRWKDMKLLSSHYNPHQVRPLFMRVTWTNNIAQKLFSSKVMKIMEAHFKFYSISRWTISSVFWSLKYKKQSVRPQCTGHSQNEALDLAPTLTLGPLYWECPHQNSWHLPDTKILSYWRKE